MSTIQTLTTEKIKEYQELVKNHGIGAVPGIYKALSEMGFGYAGWAEGVSTGNSITGMGALDFMQNTADRHGKVISNDVVTQIRIGMLSGYLEALEASAILNGGLVNDEIKFNQIRDFHAEVFEDVGLSNDFWTLKVPMEIVFNLFNEQGVNELWQKITKTQGTGLDSLLASLDLVGIVTEASYGKVYLDASNNIISNVSLATHPEKAGLIVKTIDTSSYATDASQWLSTLEGMGGEGSLFNYLLNAFFGKKVVSLVGDQDQDNQADTIHVGRGIDESHIFGLGGNDKIYGGIGKDYLYGGLGHDELIGDHQEDELYGGKGNDVLYGGNGDDLLVGGDGVDELYGDTGNDILIVGEFKVEESTDENLELLEKDKNKAYGGLGDDEIYGANGDDILVGNGGNDKIYGNGGNDTLYAGDEGSGVTDRGGENDELYGGEGDDTLIYNYSALFGGEGRLEGGVDFDTYKTNGTLCSGLIKLDTNLGDNVFTKEVLNENKTNIYSRIQIRSSKPCT